MIHDTRAASSGERPHPGLVLLHGLGSNETDMMGIAPFVDERVTVVSVRGPESHYGGFRWYDLEGEGAGLDGPGIQRNLEKLALFVDEATAAYGLDPRRIFVGGFSQGAAMAGAYAMLHPERVAGAVMASGYLPPNGEEKYRASDAVGLPVFQAHGLSDTVVTLHAAHLTRDYLRAAKVDLAYHEYHMAHEVSMQELGDLTAWFDAQLGRVVVRTDADISP